MSTELIGKTLGDFEIRRELGRGGMGVVFEAVQTSLNRRVALKVLGASLALTPQAIGRFRREAEAAAKLHHTNIVPVFAIGVDGHTHFYAMELIDGQSLDAVIRQMRGSPDADTRTELPAGLAATGAYVSAEQTAAPTGSGSGSRSSAGRFDRAATMIADVADALHHAHQQGVVHRDIKPSNMMLSADGRLSVTDFGLARILDQPGVTVTGEFVGTPAYMSPEQITAGRVPVDHRTDIYSLGAAFYELLTLRPPFTAKGRDQLLAMVIQKDPPSPRSVDPKTPRDLETICLKCLEKDPDRRYQSAKELADDLRRFVNRFAILAKRTGPVARAKKWMKRNPLLSAAGLMVLVAVVAAGVFAWQAHDAEQRRLAIERKRDEEAAAESQRAAIERGMVAALSADLASAEKAVEEAELLGASPGEVRMLRGFIAFHAGQTTEAIHHFEQAVRLMPNRVAPRALLGVAYAQGGDVDNWRVLAEVEAMAPVTSEDKLFKGQAMALDHPAEGLRLIDESLRDHNSTLGHVLRADACLILAQFTGAVTDCDEAVVSTETAKKIMQGNPVRLGVSCRARILAATANERAGNTAKATEHLTAAHREAEEFTRFGLNPDAVVSSFETAVTFDGLEGKLDRTAELRAARIGRSDRFMTAYEAYNWLCLGNDRAAEDVANEFPDERLNGHVLLFAALGRPDGRAKAMKALERFSGANSPWFNRIETAPLLFALDRPRLASTVRDLSSEGDRDRHFMHNLEERKRRLSLLEGTLSETELLGVPSSAPNEDRMFRQYHIAWKRLGTGDREGARKAFEEVYSFKMADYHAWRNSRAILIRMKDPNWPQALFEKNH